MNTQPPAPKPLDAIDFEPTDFEDARAALDEPPPGVKALKRLDPSEWLKRRRPAEVRDRLLTPAASHWLEQLPPDVRPAELPRAYPRVVNNLAEVWNNPSACQALLVDLMVDQRGGRRGFPAAVAVEIAALRDHRSTLERMRR